MTKITFTGALLGVAVIGFLGGALTVHHVMERQQVYFSAAVAYQGVLRTSVAPLKLLDEGKIDLAKADLERSLRLALDSGPPANANLNDPEMKQNFDRAIDFGRRALADRKKTLDQLMKERGG